MKRQKRKVKQASKQKTGGSDGSAGSGRSRNTASRRDFLRKVSTGGLAAAAVGGGGWYLVQSAMATIREKDLSQIGNGTPAVVQIHDPQCPRCVALQRETRDALAAFEDGELQYLVADIRTPEGSSLASAHGVGHVTLLLFDAEGRRRTVLAGANTSEQLKRAFRRHLGKRGSS